MRTADVHLPAGHAKHPQPEVRLAGQFLDGEGPGTTLWTERSGQVLGEGSGLDFARCADYVDRLLVPAWGTVESKITALSRLSLFRLCEWWLVGVDTLLRSWYRCGTKYTGEARIHPSSSIVPSTMERIRSITCGRSRPGRGLRCRRSWGWGRRAESCWAGGRCAVVSWGQRRRWVRWAPRPRRRFRAEDHAGTESPCSQACQAGSSRRT
jgi:hypothetical protein